MSRVNIPPDLARQLGLDLKDEGDLCELVVEEKMGDGSVTVESEYGDYSHDRRGPAPARLSDEKTPESTFSRALKKGTKYP